jgi:hypothetical protein
MATEDIKRLSYYEKQFLRARDFQDEQAYHIEMRRRHLIAHHSWGIVVGLEIKQDPVALTWSVQPGLAIDGFGREIIVSDPEPLDLNKINAVLLGVAPPVTLKVWIEYRLEKADRPAPGYEVCDGDNQFIRVRETFRLLYDDDPPTIDQTTFPKPFQNLEDDPVVAPWPVLLGTITWGVDPADPTRNTVIAFDPTGRRYVGLIGSEIAPPDPAQPAPAGTPVISKLTVRADETRITGKAAGTPGLLVVDGNVQVNGGQLDLRTGGGGEGGAPLRAFRSGAKDFRVRIGDDPSQAARFVVGAGNDNKFVVEGDGDTTLDGDVSIKNSKTLSLEGGRLALKNNLGAETPDLTDISRKDNNPAGHTDLRLGIGAPGDLGARLVVGPKAGDVVTESFVVENDGDVITGNNLTVNGFTLFHRGADLVISRRTGGSPRALVDLGNKLAVNFANDYTQGVAVQSDLEVQGDVSPTGLVDGRDVSVDGAKLDGISPFAKNVTASRGQIAHGGIIPLPAGFTEAQCAWLVSPALFDPGLFDINETGANAQFRIECFTQAGGGTNREVVCRWWQRGHSSTPGFVAHAGTANYIIVGVK